MTMALKAVDVANVPMISHVTEVSSLTVSTPRAPKAEVGRLVMMGHRGKGMNSQVDKRMRVLRENSIASFNEAARFAVDFVEFDVQVTKDGCPIIFHDNYIYSEDEGVVSEKYVVDLSLEEFLCYGAQKEAGKVGKSLVRKDDNGKFIKWDVESDAPLCTLQEAFEQVVSHVGFNIELKFDDYYAYSEGEIMGTLQAILKVIFSFANGRPIIFSSFQPDAAVIMRKLQSIYPVFFLTNGGTEIFTDERMNSVEEAVKLCLIGGLQGVVSDAKAIFRNPTIVSKIKELNLSLLTYGQLNNVKEAVYMQHLMGVNGVIIDLVQEITEAVSEFTNQENESKEMVDSDAKEAKRPRFSHRELSFLLRLIPELVQD